MTKSEKFVLLVQTAAIVESVSGLVNDGQKDPLGTKATVAVNVAAKLEEDELSGDLTEMCGQLIDHIYNNTIPKPAFLIGKI